MGISGEKEGTTVQGPPDAGQRRTAHEVKAEWDARLAELWREWAAELPPEAATKWKKGAAYVRHSSARSLGGEAPDAQLRRVLTLLADKHVYVPEDGVFFDVESATDTIGRGAFKRLFELALSAHFSVVGCFVNERLFRNLEQSIQYKRQFRMHGIELEYFGRYEGDRRNPAAWQLETMQDMTAELHARNTGYYVGTHLETLTRAGHPTGTQPEVYIVEERAPSFLGRRGSVTKWGLQQPLARIIQEGCKRYLAGASFADLGDWARTTELAGVSPAGREMNKRWWYNTLTNPKFAGWHAPTNYTGFRPGKESPPRPRRTRESELVPCTLPALWSKADYEEIMALVRKRWLGGKARKKYRDYLLSRVAYDDRCGCRISITEGRQDGRYWMGCKTLKPGHGGAFRVDRAARDLDELIAGLSFDSPALVQAIEAELADLVASERRTAEKFVADARIGQIKQALAALAGIDAADVRADLMRRLRDLELLDEERRSAVSRPVVEFRAALAELRHWSKAWTDADTAQKNALLVEARLRVYLRPDPERRGGLPEIVRIEAASEPFSLALAVALTPKPTFGTEKSYCGSNVRCELVLEPATRHLFSEHLVDGSLLIDLPTEPLMLSLAAFARESGRGKATIRRWVDCGVICATRNSRGSWSFPVTELARCDEAEAAERAATPFVSARRFAGLARVHPKTVRGWLAEGSIDGHRPGHGTQPYLVNVAELAKVPALLDTRNDLASGAVLTLHAFAAEAGASTTTVLGWIEAGQVHATSERHGSRTWWLIPRDELARVPLRRRRRPRRRSARLPHAA